MSPLELDKAALRARLLATRRERPPAALVAARTALAEHVLMQASRRRWRTVAAYEALRTEPGSLHLLAALSASGIRVLVPTVRPDRDLDWRWWSPDGPTGALGVAAVGAVDAVLVPALAVAADGTRLGRGGGSYDRALVHMAPATVLAATVFDDELVDELPRDRWDVPVTAAVTPAGWIPL